MIEVQEISNSGPVMQDNNVKVTSALVQHPPVTPAFAYRFDFPDRSIAFSGDTVALEAVAQMAKGADVLVHEAIDFPAMEAFVRQTIAAGASGTVEVTMAHMRASEILRRNMSRSAMYGRRPRCKGKLRPFAKRYGCSHVYGLEMQPFWLRALM